MKINKNLLNSTKSKKTAIALLFLLALFGIFSCSELAQVTSDTKPSLPSNIEPAATANSIVLKWSASIDDKGITGYEVSWKIKNEESWGEDQAVAETTFTIEELQPNTEYDIRIRAKDNANQYSEYATTAATTLSGAPSVPENLNITPSVNSLHVSWTAPSGANAIASYYVSWKVASATDWGSDTDVQTTEYTIPGLQLNVEYSVRVRAKDSTGQYSDYVEDSATTQNGPPSTPVNINVVQSNTSLGLTWPASTDDVSVVSYHISWKMSDEETWSQEITTTTPEYNIESLLSNIQYDIRIRAKNTSGEYSEYGLVTGTTVDSAPTSPGNIVSNPASTSISVTWEASTDDGTVTGYYISWKSKSDADWPTEQLESTTSYVITGLDSNITYDIRIRAKDNEDQYGPYSYARASTVDSPPTAPGNIKATASGTVINVIWEASTDDIQLTSYYVSWKDSSASSWGSENSTVNTNYEISNLVLDTVYYIRVRAKDNANQYSAFGTTQASTFLQLPNEPPGEPLKIAAVSGNRQVTVSWAAPVITGKINNDGTTGVITKYRVYYSTNSNFLLNDADVKILDQTDPNVRTLTVPDLIGRTEYYFSVTAFNAFGESVKSEEVSAWGAVDNQPPTAPENIILTSGNQMVNLSWDEPANTGLINFDGTVGIITKYVVSYSTISNFNFGDSGVTSQDQFDPNTRSLTVNNLQNYTDYYFAITAFNSTGESVKSNEQSARPRPDNAPPSKPQILDTTAGDGKVDISWQAPADTGIINGDGTTGVITSYKIYHSATANFNHEDSGVQSKSITDTSNLSTAIENLLNKTEYSFLVTAINDTGESQPSNYAKATPFASDAVPSEPQNVRYTVGDGFVRANWNAPSESGYINGDGTEATILKYRVYYSTTMGFQIIDSGVQTSDTTDGNTTTLTIGNLLNNTDYYFMVTAINGTGESSPTTQVLQRPKIPNAVPDPPTNVSATAENAGAVVNWIAPADKGIINGDGSTGVILRYTIYYSTTSGFSIQDSGVQSQLVSSGTALSATVNGLINGTQYFFAVTAHNTSGQSELSTQSSTTPAMPRLTGVLETWQDENSITPVTIGTAIRTVADLKAMTADGEFYLAAHINLGGSSWTPLFSSGNPFRGKLHGNGFIIYNLYINNTSGTYQGLFAALGGATISNLGIGVQELKVYGFAGALAGHADTAVVLDNIAVSGFSGAARKISFSGSGKLVGGIVGNFLGNLTGGYCDLSIQAPNAQHSDTGRVGGLVGYNEAGKVDGTYTGTIYNDEGHYDIGGLVGYNNGGTVTGSASGKITSGEYSENVGGLIGYNNGGTINGSASMYIDDRRDGSSSIGGLVGKSINGTIAGFVHGSGIDIRGDDELGGLVGSSNNDEITGYITDRIDIYGTDYLGGLVGISNGSRIIGSAYVDLKGRDSIGGLVGEASDSTVIGTARIEIQRGEDYLGGLVGDLSGGTVIGAACDTEVYSDDDASAYNIGGLVGYNSRGDISGYFTGWVWADNPGGDIGMTIGDPSGSSDGQKTYYTTYGGDHVGNNIDHNGVGTGVYGYENANKYRMSGLTEGANVGEWTFISNSWPRLNLPDNVVNQMSYFDDDDTPPSGFID